MSDSMITKKALADALKELMNEMPLASINVVTICDKCHMNRKSFYYHFKDKYDLVNWIFDTEFISEFRENGRNDILAFYEDAVRYFYDNRNFYRKALSVKGQNSFSDHFRDLIFSICMLKLPAILGETCTGSELNLHMNFLADAVICSLERWLCDKECLSAEELIVQSKTFFYKISEHYINKIDSEKNKIPDC